MQAAPEHNLGGVPQSIRYCCPVSPSPSQPVSSRATISMANGGEVVAEVHEKEALEQIAQAPEAADVPSLQELQPSASAMSGTDKGMPMRLLDRGYQRSVPPPGLVASSPPAHRRQFTRFRRAQSSDAAAAHFKIE